MLWDWLGMHIEQIGKYRGNLDEEIFWTVRADFERV